MRSIRTRWQRRWTIAAAIFVVSLGSGARAETANPYGERSRLQLPVMLALDAKMSSALEARSLADIQALREIIGTEKDRAEQLVNGGGVAVACDLALFNLDLIAGFAVNKLDGEGRYQNWMEGESIRLLADYRELIGACAGDASLNGSSRLTAGLIEDL